MTKLPLLCLITITACSPSTNDVLVNLAPDLVSSLDGTLSVHTIVLADRQPSPSESVEISVTYTDRNGTAHMIAPVDGTTDKKGAFDATLTGLMWDGTGTIKSTVMAGGAPLMAGGNPVEGTATFAVLDRTPPKVTIMAPANNQVHRATNNTIQVHVTDEIGVSQVYFDSSDNQNRGRSTITTGATDLTINFDFQAPDAIGTTIMLYALGADLSGNEGAAAPVSVTVIQ